MADQQTRDGDKAGSQPQGQSGQPQGGTSQTGGGGQAPNVGGNRGQNDDPSRAPESGDRK
jgi:hypothetical protein